jgi:hypothetical protein
MVLQPLLAARENPASIELTHRWKNLIHGSSEIVDALHAGLRHRRRCGVERAGQVDRPAAGLDQHGVKAEPARVERGVMDA